MGLHVVTSYTVTLLVSSPLLGTVDGYCKQDHLVCMSLRCSEAVGFYSELLYMHTEIGTDLLVHGCAQFCMVTEHQ